MNDFPSTTPPPKRRWLAAVVVGLTAVSSAVGATRAAAEPSGVSSGTPGAVVGWSPDPNNALVAVPAAARTGVSAVVAGTETAIALKSGGVIQWGVPYSIPLGLSSGVTAIAANFQDMFAIKQGTLYAWGKVPDAAQNIPAEVRTGGPVSAVAVGRNAAMALQSGRVREWGAMSFTVPTAAQSGVTAVAIAPNDYGRNDGLAIKNGGVVAWGEGAEALTVPSSVSSGVTAIAGGHLFAVAVRNGRVIVWGAPSAGGVLAVPVAAQSGVVSVTANATSVMALKSDGSVVTWGASTWTPVFGHTAVSTVGLGSVGNGPRFAVVPTPASTYRIVQKSSGKCVTAPGSSDWWGATLVLEPCSDAYWYRQQFAEIVNADYTRSFEAWFDGGFLDTADGMTDIGTSVVLGGRTSDLSQSWKWQDSPYFGEVVQQESSGLLLDTAFGDTDDGTAVVIGAPHQTPPTEQWGLTK